MSTPNQTQSTFTLRLAQAASATSETVGSAPTIDLMAAYRNSRMAAQQSLSSMRGMSIGIRPNGSTSYYRRAV